MENKLFYSDSNHLIMGFWPFIHVILTCFKSLIHVKAIHPGLWHDLDIDTVLTSDYWVYSPKGLWHDLDFDSFYVNTSMYQHNSDKYS